jgi:PAS domain S-box-containing protein
MGEENCGPPLPVKNLDQIVDSIPHMVWISGPDGNTEYHNARIREYSGLAAADVAGQGWQQLLHPEDLPATLDKWNHSIRTGDPIETEYRMRRHDGAYRWHLARAHAQKDEQGRIIRWVGTCTDVQDLKAARDAIREGEEEARKSSDLLRAVANGTTDAVFVKDAGGRYLLINQAGAKFLNLSVEQIIGRTDDQLFDPESTRAIAAGDLRVIESGQAETSELVLTSDETTSIRLVTKAPYRDEQGHVIGIVGISRDISDWKKLAAERDLLLNRIQVHIERLPLAYILFDACFRISNWNPAAERVFGYSKTEAIGMALTDLAPPTFASQAPAFYAEIKSGAVTAHSINENITRTGQTITCEWFNTPLFNVHGEFSGLLRLGLDVTERIGLEDRLRQSQKRLEHVVSSSPAILFTLAVEGEIRRLTWISENVATLGYESQAAFAPGWWQEHVHPDDLNRVLDDYRQGLFQLGELAVEYRFRHQNGKYLWLRSELRLLRNAQDAPVEIVGSLADITERKRLEDQFRQSQKMEAIGRLAGGIAHDFNNLLTVINGYSGMALNRLPTADRGREMLEQVIAAGDRAASLTRQLLAFSRNAIIEPVTLNLTTLIGAMEKMLHPLVGENIVMTIACDPEPCSVKADPIQLEQVMLNLAVNARDAMPTGGRLLIEVRNVILDESFVRNYPDVSPGRYVLVSVSDTGTGIDERTMTRIFEPFFTTKGEQGTGLGLATVHGIVEQSSGFINVASEVGRGTTFRVYFPRVEDQATNTRAPAKERLPGGSEMVLLAEDEPGVRNLSAFTLRQSGYQVLEAANGIEALAVAAQHGGRIDLLLTDVVMPEMGGGELSKQLLARQPGMKVLFMSGYTDDAIVRHGVEQTRAALLQKPFGKEAMLHKVREALDTEQQREQSTERDSCTTNG